MPLCQEEAFDLAFVIDGSTSVGRRDFNQTLQFVASFVSAFNISANATRVGLVQYASETQLEFDFLRWFDKASIVDDILDTVYLRGSTVTGAALKFASNNLLVPSAGWRENAVPAVVVVVTDGQSSETQEVLLHGIGKIKAKADDVLAFGVGSEIGLDELELIASSPNNVFQVENFVNLSDQEFLAALFQLVSFRPCAE